MRNDAMVRMVRCTSGEFYTEVVPGFFPFLVLFALKHGPSSVYFISRTTKGEKRVWNRRYGEVAGRHIQIKMHIAHLNPHPNAK